MKKLILFLIVLFASPALATTRTAPTCSAADVQATINASSTGDTVLVPGPCTANWGSTVTIPNTMGITVQARGTVTVTTDGFQLNQGSATSVITGFTFTDSPNTTNCNTGTAIQVAGAPGNAPFRIYNNTFTNQSNVILMCVQGNGPGLIDHNTFNGGGAAEEIHNLGIAPGDNSGWQDNIQPGSANMVIIENNLFNNNDTGVICSAIETFYGGRNALRHNTMNFCQIDQHGTAGAVGARWWEAYNNNFNVPNSQNQCCFVTMRGGTGVIFNNTTTGTNTGAGSITVVEEDTGTWPLAYQIGSGINGFTNGHVNCGATNNAPAYIWGNGSIGVGSGSSNVQLNRDFFTPGSQPASMHWEEQTGDTCSTTYTYAPYTYPHPLDNCPAVTIGVVSGGCASIIVVPTLTTTTASSITTMTASSGGTVSDTGGGAVTLEGVCYATTANPTAPCINSTGTASPFTIAISGLTPGTLYHYRAFAANSAGTGFGSDLTFTTVLPTPLFSYLPGVYTAGTIHTAAGNSSTSTTIPLVISDIQPRATICYRTDGVAPTATVAGTCDSPALPGTVSPDGNNQAFVTVAGTETVKAIATQVGFTNSAPVTAVYTFAAGCQKSVITAHTSVSNAAGTQITTTWTTSVPADSLVIYGSPNAGTMGPYDATAVTSHSVSFNTLPGTSYNIDAFSRAVVAAGVCGSGYEDGDLPIVNTPTLIPAGTFDYGITMIGPHYLTQGKGVYLSLGVQATVGKASYVTNSLQMAISGLPPFSKVTWSQANPGLFTGQANTASATNGVNYDTIKIHDFSGAQEAYILTSQGGTTPTGPYTLTITGGPPVGCVAPCVQTHAVTWTLNVISSATPFSGVPLATGTIPSSPPAIPGLAAYKDAASVYGAQNCAQDADLPATSRTIRPNNNTGMLSPPPGNPLAQTQTLGSWFYDGLLSNYEIGNMLQGDPTYGGQNWSQCYENQKDWYTKHYAYPTIGEGISNQIMFFSKGVYTDYLVTGDPLDLGQIKYNILNKVGGSNIQTPVNAAYVDVSYLQRETAYVMRNTTHGVSLGYNPVTYAGQTASQIRDYAMEHVLGQIDEMCLSQNAQYWEYFMTGLQAEDLIEYYDLVAQDSRIPPAIACLADWEYTNYWQSVWNGSFPYVKNQFLNKSTTLDGGSCYSTLNNMIAPMYGWLYQYTGDSKWQQRGDEIFYAGTNFAGCYTGQFGISGTYLTWPTNSNGKNFSQNYHWAPEYVKWRNVPAFSVTPASVGFYNTVVSTTSGPRTITFANPTAAAVTVTTLAKSGVNVSSFTVGSGTCGTAPFAVAAHGSCTITVTLAAGSALLATYSATLTATVGATGATYPVTLNGLATRGMLATPAINLTGGSYPAGTQFNITGTAGASLCSQYQTSTGIPPASVLSSLVATGEPPTTDGGSCIVGDLSATPTSYTLTTVGANQYLRSMAQAAGYLSSPEILELYTITASATTATLLPASLAFGAQLINTTSSASTATFTNTGSTPVIVSNVTTSANFALGTPSTGTPCAGTSFTLAIGTACTIGVTFTPTAVQSYSGSLSITSNATGSPQVVSLSGQGTSPITATLTPATVAFGNQTVNTTSSVNTSATFTNTGSVSVVVSNVVVSGNFSRSGGSCAGTSFTLAAGQSCTIGVTFSPTAAIAYNGTLSVSSNAAGSPNVSNLTGQGVQAIITWSSPQGGNAYNFGNVPINTSATNAPVTLTNTGNGPLQVALTITGTDATRFVILSTTCTNPLAAGSNCTVVVTFTPTAAASYLAALTETDPLASNSPQSLALRGAGFTPPTQPIAPFPPIILLSKRRNK